MIVPDQEGGLDMAKSSEFALIICGKPVHYFNQDDGISRFRFISSVY